MEKLEMCWLIIEFLDSITLDLEKIYVSKNNCSGAIIQFELLKYLILSFLLN